MHKLTKFTLLTASMLLLLCLSGAAFADDSTAQIDSAATDTKPPEIPDGPMQQGEGEQPPEMPDGEQPQGEGEQPPEMPDGEQPQGEGEQPPEMPGNQTMIGEGELPPDQASASSPLSLIGVIAGLGIAGVAMLRTRK